MFQFIGLEKRLTAIEQQNQLILHKLDTLESVLKEWKEERESGGCPSQDSIHSIRSLSSSFTVLSTQSSLNSQLLFQENQRDQSTAYLDDMPQEVLVCIADSLTVKEQRLFRSLSKKYRDLYDAHVTKHFYKISAQSGNHQKVIRLDVDGWMMNADKWPHSPSLVPLIQLLTNAQVESLQIDMNCGSHVFRELIRLLREKNFRVKTISLFLSLYESLSVFAKAFLKEIAIICSKMEISCSGRGVGMIDLTSKTSIEDFNLKSIEVRDSCTNQPGIIYHISKIQEAISSIKGLSELDPPINGDEMERLKRQTLLNTGYDLHLISTHQLKLIHPDIHFILPFSL